MSRSAIGIAILAAVVGVSLWIGQESKTSAATHRDNTFAARPLESEEHIRISGKTLTAMVEDDLVSQAVELISLANAAGGLEMQDAGFHAFPGQPLVSVFVYMVYYAKFDEQGQSLGIEGIKVDLLRDDVLTLGVVDATVVESVAHPGHWDVSVKFNAAVSAYAKTRQRDREFALESNMPPLDQGVALVHNNVIYGDFTYGEIHDSMDANMGSVIVVSGTDIGTATAIATALLP